MHKKIVAVAVAGVEMVGPWLFDRWQVGTSPSELRALAEWPVEREVDGVVMESTPRYWRPVWEALERGWQPPAQQARRGPRAGTLHFAQAQSNEGPRGRKRGFSRRRTAGETPGRAELTLSFVPDVTQQLWRPVARRRHRPRPIIERSAARQPGSNGQAEGFVQVPHFRRWGTAKVTRSAGLGSDGRSARDEMPRAVAT